MTLSQNTRCLGHGCNQLDACLRHLAIRKMHRPADVEVSENACAESAHAFVPLKPAATPPSFNHDDAWRSAIEGE